MITEEDCQILSKLLNINFVYPRLYSLKTACSLFSSGNDSYICFDVDKEQYDFLLCYSDVHFSFQTKSLNPKDIHQAMKDFTEREYVRAIQMSQRRSVIYKQLKKSL